MLHQKRFELALEKIKPSEWERFEQFASQFLVGEFSNLRTLASPGGDGGRDAELYSSTGDLDVVFQYSVTAGWKAKIEDTIKKLAKNFPDTRELIYITSQQIGAAADALKKDARKQHRIIIDIRDRNYFLERYLSNEAFEKAAISLCRDIVDPYLESKEVTFKKAQALSEGESRAALVFLEMQWEDDTRDKGLTRLAFEGLVRSVLRHTRSDARLHRTEIHAAVGALLPGQEESFVKSETDKALNKLTKRYIRQHPDETFCLTFEEAERIKERLAETEALDISLRAELDKTLSQHFTDSERTKHPLKDLARKSIEQFLLQRGEQFVKALETGQLARLSFEPLQEIVKDNCRELHVGGADSIAQKLAFAAETLLISPSGVVSSYLKSVADAYTLLAFLKQTPDVQTAVQKMFSHGEIWLDTSIVLPLLAEDLLPEESRSFRRVMKVARDSGLKLKITDGVLEEVESHTHRGIICANMRSGEWKGGNIPYIYAFYISQGRSSQGFSTWIERFRGQSQPERDIADYLQRFFGIERADIATDAEKLEATLRHNIKEEWTKIHTDRRQRYGNDIDPLLALRLASHDTENYAGVLVRRKQEGDSALGFTSWWLSLDHLAFTINKKVQGAIGGRKFPSPVMSMDFLANYLAFGPLRDKAARSAVKSIPVALDSSVSEFTPELLEIARKVREDSHDQEEYIVQRRVRDALDKARRRTGTITSHGLQIPGSLIEG